MRDLPRGFFRDVKKLVELFFIEIVHILCDIELGAGFSGGGFDNSQISNKHGLGFALEFFGKIGLLSRSLRQTFLLW